MGYIDGEFLFDGVHEPQRIARRRMTHAALGLVRELGYSCGRHGPHLAPGEPAAERDSFADVVLVGRLREAIWRLNPTIPKEAREEALRKVLRVGDALADADNRAFHRLLRDGVPVEYRGPTAASRATMCGWWICRPGRETTGWRSTSSP
jgi:type I site-specific restriction-modification system R (restriction) subunit